MLGKNLIQATSGAATLADGWDLENIAFNGSPNSATIVNQTSGLFWKADGTALYAISREADTINQYTLSSAWDIATITSTGSYSVNSLDTSPYSVFISSDGTTAYFSGGNTSTIYALSLSTAWDITSASSLNSFVDISTLYGVSFKTDGTIMYAIANNTVRQFALSTAWDITTATLSTTVSISVQDSGQRNLTFKPDGTKMYVAGAGNDRIYEYSLSTPWDVNTISYVGFFSHAFLTTALPSLAFDSTGSLLYVAGGSDLFRINLSTAWDRSTAYYQPFSTECISVQLTANPSGIYFKPDGTRLYIADPTGDAIHEFTLSTPFELTTTSFLRSLSVIAQGTGVQDVFFRDDGLKMYVLEALGDTVDEYNLSTAWDISTASYLQEFDITAQDSSPTGIFFRADGTKLYAAGTENDSIYEYNLSTAWDVTSATHANTYSVAGSNVNPRSVIFKPDGTLMLVLDANAGQIERYDLSIPWDITSASFVVAYSFTALTGVATGPLGMYVTSNGTRLFMSGGTNDAIFSFAL